MKRLFPIFILISLMLAACSTEQSDSSVNSAITETQSAKSTNTIKPTDTPLPTTTSTPEPTATPTATPTITPTPINPVGRLIQHEADETIAYEWFTYVPSNLSKERLNYILVSGLHGNIQTENYEEIIEESRIQAAWTGSRARDLQAVLLVPVVPTSPRYVYYPVAFDVTSFLDSTPSFYQRADLEVNLMIDKLLSDLRTDGYKMSDKVFIEGFSAGGMFAQRYTLLHPERVQAIAAGHCGGTFTLPESSYNGVQIDWPVGINDFFSLVGNEFDRDAYLQVPQYIYIGDQDTRITLDGVQVLWRSQSQIFFIQNTFGYYGPEILEKQLGYLNSIGYNNIMFRMYPGVGHKHTSTMLTDSLDFLRAHRE